MSWSSLAFHFSFRLVSADARVKRVTVCPTNERYTKYIHSYFPAVAIVVVILKFVSFLIKKKKKTKILEWRRRRKSKQRKNVVYEEYEWWLHVWTENKKKNETYKTNLSTTIYWEWLRKRLIITRARAWMKPDFVFCVDEQFSSLTSCCVIMRSAWMTFIYFRI